MRIGRTLAALGALAVATVAPAQEPPPVNAGTESGQKLRAPAEREEFTFAVFGDRTGGRDSGLKVLRQAVAMSNALDPAFVMTVGDLINGYNREAQWLAQMRAYKEIVGQLRMPWYPVAGNHDVYARPSRAGGHTGLFKEHFGPLYYSFDYRWAHFVVLFSDEALAFRNPAKTQNLSPAQMEWLAKDLASTEAEQVYVFLHHPRWLYAGCNWPQVHQLLVDDGRVRAVFAGHIHIYRDDGVRDGIHYYTLATTGANRGSSVGAFDHIDLVRVRRDGFSLAVLPVPSALGGDVVLGRELDEIRALAYGGWTDADGEIRAVFDGPRTSIVGLDVSNPTERPLRVVAAVSAPKGWAAEHDTLDVTLEPGATQRLPVRVTTTALQAGTPARVSFKVVAKYVLRSGRAQDVTVWQPARVTMAGVDAQASAKPEANHVLALTGKNAVRIDLSPAANDLSALTVECWVRGVPPAGRMGLVAKTESSAWALFWADKGAPYPSAPFHISGKGYVIAKSPAAWDWDAWTHVAGTYDGQAVRLWVAGKLVAEAEATGGITNNSRPLYIGADPDRRSRATSFFTGEIDEVRVSNVARYAEPFRPARVHARDRHTLLLLHFDRVAHGFHPDDSGHGHHGVNVGEPELTARRR